MSTPFMIQFDQVSLAFSGHPLFEGACFTLQKGERCGLVGRNGSGKSTLFRVINGEMEPDAGTVAIPKNYRIGYLKQHINFTEPTLIQEAALGLPEHEKDDIYKAEKILFGLGFTEEDLEKAPTGFSGGYQLRLNLTKVLVSEPNCLLLDEPTNYLDILSIRWLQNFLSRWQGEFILISHDRQFMDAVTTHTMGIHREKLRKIKGTTIDFFQQILMEEELHEKSRIKSEKKKAHLQSFVDRFGAKASKATLAQSKMKMIEREPVLEKLNAMSELSFAFQEAPFPGKKMLHAKHLHFSYTDEPLIEDFSIEIEKGERVAIIGKNGRGKSTLLRLMGVDLTQKKGELELSDNTRIGYFGQTHVDRLDGSHMIEEEIALANPYLNYTEIKGIAGAMMFSGDLSAKKIAVLSGGEKSRVLLGKIVAKPCNLLLLDEPTHHLDIESIEALIDALEDFGGSVVIVTHSELILRRLALDKIVLCEEAKQTVFLGNYDEFLEKIGWDEKKKAAPKTPQPNVRKERAEEVAKRAAVIKPLEKQIHALEQQIIALEEEQNRNFDTIEEIKAQGIRKKQIQLLEAQLYELYELLEKKKKEFD
ncbi:MAG TPA: ABC-F family ATP-binding cassette domain-containing protein [Rhabdochlamydiaceae bacterium]|nr:ABC-F family ATP-binding cassette domain-containing protein [Rhabdochlamydiaceae bacterium]